MKTCKKFKHISLKEDTQKDNNYMKGCSILYAVSELIEDITIRPLRQLKFNLVRKINAEDIREVENILLLLVGMKTYGHFETL